MRAAVRLPTWDNLARCQALVIDGSPASRAALAAMLREFGVGAVVQTTRAQDARRLLEGRRFDIVVCEYHFDGQPMTGQDLMDDLRMAHLLPLSTVVVMVSSEAAYTNVACAAEAALDAYLIKPHTALALRERLVQSMERKGELREIIEHVETGRFAEAAALCQRRCDERGPNWLNAARIGAELWLRLGDAQAASALFDLILSTQALPWARLGLARSQYQAGAVQQARRTLESLINDQPGFADAYDVMGRVLLDQGEPEQALRALRQATTLTPGNVSRLLKLELLAFFHGDRHEAAEVLKKASGLGLNSCVFDLQGLVLLGMLQFDRGDARGLAQSLRNLTAAREAQPASARLRRFETLLSCFSVLLERRLHEAVLLVRDALDEVRAPDFEFEAACNLLCLVTRMLAREVRLDEASEQVAALADRFAVSRTSCELLCRSVQGRPDCEALIRARYERICAHAEEAVSHTVAGAPQQAVQALLAQYESTLNAKLLELAMHTLERHRTKIADAAALSERARSLNARYRSYGTQVQLPGRPPGAAVPHPHPVAATVG